MHFNNGRRKSNIEKINIETGFRDMIFLLTLLQLHLSATKRIFLRNEKLDTWTVGGVCKRSWTLQSNWNTLPSLDNSKENCTLQTQFWVTKPAHRVYIEIDLKTRKCSSLDLQPTVSCRNNLTLELHTGEEKGEKKYKQIAVLPTVSVPEDNKTKEFRYVNSITVEGLKDLSGIQLIFRTVHYAGSIVSVNVSYEDCPEVSGELVDFQPQPAPDIIENEIKVNGKCAANAVRSGNAPPFMTCKFDGTYNISGECICDMGYYKISTSCHACEPGKYKPSIGNDQCFSCGAHVKKGAVPRTSCECLDNYHREIGHQNDFKWDCHSSPARPPNVTVSNITSNRVSISWQKPSTGSSPLGVYIIVCKNCDSNIKEFPINTTDCTITIYGLGAFATYSLSIWNENVATNLTGYINSFQFTFRTREGVPGIVRNVMNFSNSDGDNRFSWEPPFAQGSADLTYLFMYGDTTKRIKETTFLLQKEAFDKTYIIKIGTEARVNGNILSGPVFSGTVKIPGGIAPVMAFSIAGGCIVFVVLLLVASFCIWRKRNPAYLQVIRMEDGTVKLPARFYSGGKLYVDPKSYSIVDDAVCEFAFELNRSELKFGEKIGEGEFAEVHKGFIMKGGNEQSVAIKTLKPGTSKSDRDDFLSEAAILGQFCDPNVIFLEGVILKDEPNAIVLEYMVHGSLDKYLREHEMQFTVAQLLEMMRGVSSGMKYLSEMGFIHRDLAARNILVNEKMTCKVADFGMSLEIKVDDTVDATSGKVPIRWTSPEAIQFKKFTTASDVWSYGILMWEIMSYGERPYWEWTNYEVLERVNSGYRLPPPMGCPRVVHDLMLCCWNKERTKRPLFSVIRDRIDDWLQIPELLDELGPVVKLDDNLDYTIMQTVNKWLEAIGMGRYANNFLEQGFATPRQILLLTMDDLEALGVGALDHRKKIFKAIGLTKSQVETNLVRMNSRTGTFRASN